MLFYTPLRSGAGRGNDAGHVRDQLSAYIDYELSDAEREQVRDHLRHCPDCENDLATLKATKQVLADRPLMAAPRSFALTPEMVGRGQRVPVVRRQVWSLAARLRAGSAVSVLVFLLLFLSNDVILGSQRASVLHTASVTQPSLAGRSTVQNDQFLSAPAAAATETTAPAAAAATDTTAPAAAAAGASTASPVAPGAGGVQGLTSDTPPPAPTAAAANAIPPPELTQQYKYALPLLTPGAAAATPGGAALPGANPNSDTQAVQPHIVNAGPLPTDAVAPLAVVNWARLLEGLLLVLAIGLALGSVLAMRQRR